ncbi:MAG: hypothetical protein JWM75_2356 [Sphingomonas bacterium]|nr:hypothetical protein [Sphingomonas bacterium]
MRPMMLALMVFGSAAAGAAVAAVPSGQDIRSGYAALAGLPDWSGVWQPEWSTIGPRNRANPKFTPAAEKTVAAFKALQAEGKNLQTEAANCVPNGMPQIMRTPYPIEFIFSPGRVTIAIETYSQVRRIYTDGQRLPEDPDLTFNGSSIGRWDGEALVIDTIGISPAVSILPGVHATEQTRIQERVSLKGPNLMTIQTTVTDPTIFAEPLVTTQDYVRERDWQIREYVCQENNRDAADEFGRPSIDLD